MRMLIRKYPDLAEIVLDHCYKEKKNHGEGIFVDMTFEFIEDSFNYRQYSKLRDSLVKSKYSGDLTKNFFADLSTMTRNRGFLAVQG